MAHIAGVSSTVNRLSSRRPRAAWEQTASLGMAAWQVPVNRSTRTSSTSTETSYPTTLVCTTRNTKRPDGTRALHRANAIGRTRHAACSSCPSRVTVSSLRRATLWPVVSRHAGSVTVMGTWAGAKIGNEATAVLMLVSTSGLVTSCVHGLTPDSTSGLVTHEPFEACGRTWCDGLWSTVGAIGRRVVGGDWPCFAGERRGMGAARRRAHSANGAS